MPERKLTVTDGILTAARVNNREAPEIRSVETTISGEQTVRLAEGASEPTRQALWRDGKCLSGTKKSANGSQV